MTRRQGRIWTDDPAGPSTHVVPTADVTYDLGRPDARFRNIYFGGELFGDVQMDVVTGLSSALRTDGLSVIGSNPNGLHVSRTAPTLALGSASEIATFRTEHFIVRGGGPVSNIRAVFGNWIWSAAGGCNNQSYIMVKASLEKLSPLGGTVQDQTRIRFLFNAKDRVFIKGGGLITSDPLQIELEPGERFFIRTGVGVSVINNPPAAPTLTPAITGGTIAAGTYYVVIAYVTDDFETFPSTATSAVIASGTTGSIVVTSPVVGNAGAIGYRVYASVNSGAGGAPQFAASDVVPIGVNFTITKQMLTGAYGSNGNVDNVSQYIYMGYPTGGSMLGGSTLYGMNNGEGFLTTYDVVADGSTQLVTTDAVGSPYSPVSIVGNSGGNTTPSVFVCGDSIAWGRNDDGWRSSSGGYITRGLLGATTLTFQNNLVPQYGYHVSAVPGERVTQFLNQQLNHGRWELSKYFTNFVNEYGINDLNGGGNLATLQINVLKVGAVALANNQKFFQTTLLPFTASSDGFRTVVNQTQNALESRRVAFNNWVRNASTVGTTISGETPIGLINSSNKIYYFANLFVTGTEVITDNGSPAGAYTYNSFVTINGIMYADGITFTTAPVTGHTLLAQYRTSPGFVATCGGSDEGGFFDPCVYVEVNSSNVLTLNGGFWQAAQAPVFTGTISTSSASTFLGDSAQAFTVTTPTVPSYKGYCVLTNNYCACINYNTATLLVSSGGFFLCSNPTVAINPGFGASYIVYNPVTTDGIHPSSYGHMLAAACIDRTKFR